MCPNLFKSAICNYPYPYLIRKEKQNHNDDDEAITTTIAEVKSKCHRQQYH